MTTNELAQAILNRQNPTTPVVFQADLQTIVGADAMSEALRLRWLEPNMETGFLQVTTNLGAMEQMRALAAQAPAAATPSPAIENLRTASLAHAQRPLVEIKAPMTGIEIPPNATAIPTTPAQPTPPTTVPAKPATPPRTVGQPAPKVGDSVMVSEENETYPAKVQSVNPDGRYVLSFGAKKPRVAREYKADEVRFVEPAKA